MPRPRTITSSPTPAHGRAGRRRSPRLRLRPPNDGDRNCATCSRAVAELAHAVVAPAVDRSGGREPAGVTIARSDGHEAQAPGDSDRNKAVGGGAVAELAIGVAAPAIGLAARRETTGVRTAGSDGYPAKAGHHGHRIRATGAVATRMGTLRVSNAELAVLVVSPTVGRPAGREAATVSAADGESGEAEVPCCSPRRVRR